jgi:hypothetical protein
MSLLKILEYRVICDRKDAIIQIGEILLCQRKGYMPHRTNHLAT